MRKFIITLLILIALGGVVFYFGWVQFTVPPGSYGVMRSKTHGVDREIVREGKFRWVWYRLIPTNVSVSVFSVSTLQRPISVTGALPSGDTYASFAGVGMDFSYEVSGSLSFNIRADGIPGLMENLGITDQASLDAYGEETAGRMTGYAVQRLGLYARDEQKLEAILVSPLAAELNRDLAQAFPEAEHITCTLTVVRFPDFALYGSAKAMYNDYLDRQRELLAPRVSAAAADHITSQLRFDELAKYGDLLTRYPVLLDYLALEKGIAPVKAAPAPAAP